jgi:electron transfer flavoprotein alpha subunit
MTKPLRIAALAKQIPRVEHLVLGDDRRLVRNGAHTDINPFCRRAIAKGTELARKTGGSCIVFTLGPPPATDLLAEAIAWGADEGVLVSDPAFGGSDTFATASTLAAALQLWDPFDLVLMGTQSIDGDTGQMPAQLAQILDLPLVCAVRELRVDGDRVQARCERDDGFVTAHVQLPAVLTATERLCQPAKVPAESRGFVTDRIHRVTATDLGSGVWRSGLWGQQGSLTEVGDITMLERDRKPVRLSGPLGEQVKTVAEMIKRSATHRIAVTSAAKASYSPAISDSPSVIAVVAEPGLSGVTRELIGGAAQLAGQLGARTTLLATESVDPVLAWQQGAEKIVTFRSRIERTSEPLSPDDFADAVARRTPGPRPWAILAPSTTWGREVAGRLSVLLHAGLTGDAIALEVADRRLVCLKPGFGGRLAAQVTATSPVQIATIRPGVLPALPLREQPGVAESVDMLVTSRRRVTVTDREVNDAPERLAKAQVVVCVGRGVAPGRYGELKPLLTTLRAELAATRKVTDAGWLPRSRQIGITGRAIAPAVYMLLGASGSFNHMAGIAGAGLVIAVNSDPAARALDSSDVAIVADWAEFASLLADELAPDRALLAGG